MPVANSSSQRYSYGPSVVKRSQSCTSQEDGGSVISRLSVNTTGHIRDRSGDFYDTASTTTTLTPTPSESGRETPRQLQFQQQSYSHHHQHTNGSAYPAARSGHATQQQQRTSYEQSERELIMDLQSQSRDYAQARSAPSSDSHRLDGVSSAATAYSAASEDGEEIPYHAREDSRPFTYGDPTGVQLSPTGAMIKAQSGLSSPSLVRKHLGRSPAASSTDTLDSATHKNANGRTDFEEMLMKRREQILSDKYSIGDSNGNIVNNNSVNSSANKWNTSSPSINVQIEKSENRNGYHYREPLKRSNTLDGFGRENGNGYVSDG